MKNKTLFTVLGIVLLLGVGVMLLPKIQTTQAPEVTSIQEKVISVKQTINNKTETVSQKKEATALELLQSTAKVKMKGEGENAFVTVINGIEASESKKQFWAFYVNGKQAEVGAGSYILQDGDKIEWKLESY